jgi:hypothetical protein
MLTETSYGFPHRLLGISFTGFAVSIIIIKTLKFVLIRDARDTVFDGYPADWISG